MVDKWTTAWKFPVNSEGRRKGKKRLFKEIEINNLLRGLKD